MHTDKDGQELIPGDVVTLRARVLELYDGRAFCKVRVEDLEGHGVQGNLDHGSIRTASLTFVNRPPPPEPEPEPEPEP